MTFAYLCGVPAKKNTILKFQGFGAHKDIKYYSAWPPDFKKKFRLILCPVVAPI